MRTVLLAILSRGQESRSQRGFDLPSLCHKFIKFSCLDTRPRVEFPSSDKYLRAALKFCLQKCNQTNHVMMQVILLLGFTGWSFMLLRVRTGEGKTFQVVNSMSVYVLSNHPSPLFAFKYKSNEGETSLCRPDVCCLPPNIQYTT